MSGQRIRVDITRCDGYGYCADIIPERIRLDSWGYPILEPLPLDQTLTGLARRAVAECPRLALRIDDDDD